MKMNNKIIIYQVLPRLFGNTNDNCIPNSSFEVNGSGKLNDFTIEILNEIKQLGCSHIWFTGIIRHATKTSFKEFGIKANHPHIVKGEAGSPYSITDYYDISPELAVNVKERANEFKNLIKRVHSSGLKILIDFVPNHLSREYRSIQKPETVIDFGQNDKKDYSFHPMNNFYYLPEHCFTSPLANSVQDLESGTLEYSEFPAKVTGNDCITASPSTNDWFETVKLNYGIDIFNSYSKHFQPTPNTWVKMKEVLLFWLELGVDGFRCDMAGMVPEEFWKWVIESIKLQFKEALFIGELYEKERYHTFIDFCKFDLLYDKVGLYDTLKAITNREKVASDITYCWQSLNGIENKMLNFIENHDEVRSASPFFTKNPLGSIPALTISLMLNNAPFMIYFGQELGENGMDQEGYSKMDGKTSIFDYWSINTVREWILGTKTSTTREIYKKLLNIAAKEEAIYNGDRYDIQYANGLSEFYNPNSCYSLIRKCPTSLIIISVNFDNSPASISLNMPLEMFSYFKIADDNLYKSHNLLTGKKDTLLLSSKVKFNIQLEKQGVEIIKLSL